MQHTTCRTALLHDELDDDVESHLAHCAPCAHFAAQLRTITVAAPGLAVPPAPPGLADRVLERVAAERSPDAGNDRRWLTAPARRSLLLSSAIAAAALLVLGTLALVTDGGDRPTDVQQVLLASATRTEDAGSATLAVEGETEVTLSVPEGEAQVDGRAGAEGPGDAPRRPGTPDFDALPAELHGHMARQWARVLAEFERQLAAFEAEVEATLERGRQQIDRALDEADRRMREAFERFGQPSGGAPPSRPSGGERAGDAGGRDESAESGGSGDRARPGERGAPGATGPVAPAAPRSLSVRLAVSATGQVGFDGHVRLDGTVRPVDDPAAAAAFQVAVADRHAAVQGPDGEWVRVPNPAGPLGSVLLRPGAVTRVLRAAGRDAEVIGEAAIDGQRVRRYRFTFDPGAVGRADLRTDDWTAEAAIDDDGRVRSLHVRSAGSVDRSGGVRWATNLRMSLGHYGAALAPAPAAAGEARGAITAAERSSLILYPFNAAVAASLRASS